MNSPHKGHWRGALVFSLICAWTNSWANNGYTSDFRRHRDYYDVTVMFYWLLKPRWPSSWQLSLLQLRSFHVWYNYITESFITTVPTKWRLLNTRINSECAMDIFVDLEPSPHRRNYTQRVMRRPSIALQWQYCWMCICHPSKKCSITMTS